MYSTIQFSAIILLYFKGTVFGNWSAFRVVQAVRADGVCGSSMLALALRMCSFCLFVGLFVCLFLFLLHSPSFLFLILCH